MESERLKEGAWKWFAGLAPDVSGVAPALPLRRLSNDVDADAAAVTNGTASGLQAALVCFQRHPDIRLALFPVIDHFSRAHWITLFSTVLPAAVATPREFLALVHDLLPALRSASGVAAALTADGVVDWLVEKAMATVCSQTHTPAQMCSICRFRLFLSVWLFHLICVCMTCACVCV